MKKYLVRNAQQYQPLRVGGRYLSPASVGNHTSEMWVTLSELNSDIFSTRIKDGRLILAKGEIDDSLTEVTPLVVEVAVEDYSEAPAEEFAGAVEPEVTLDSPEGEELSDEEFEKLIAGDEESELSLSGAPLDELVESPAKMPLRYTEDELKSHTVVELKKLAKELNLKTSGKEADLVERILAAQAEPPYVD